jgi:Domain of unknown function (DUF5615)
MKFIIDEDLSPRVARYLCQEFYFDAIAIRDRGLLGATDPEVLEYAFKEDRILVTANIRDNVTPESKTLNFDRSQFDSRHVKIEVIAGG